MVDFDNETTIGTPAVDVQRIVILERRYNLFEALEAFNRNRMRGIDADLAIVRARLATMFLEVAELLERNLDKKDYAALKKGIYGAEATEEEMLNAIETINRILDKVQLTKIDTKVKYDSRRVEVENQAKSI